MESLHFHPTSVLRDKRCGVEGLLKSAEQVAVRMMMIMETMTRKIHRPCRRLRYRRVEKTIIDVIPSTRYGASTEKKQFGYVVCMKMKWA